MRVSFHCTSTDLWFIPGKLKEWSLILYGTSVHPYSFRSDKPRSLAEPQPDDEYSEEYVGKYSNYIVRHWVLWIFHHCGNWSLSVFSHKAHATLSVGTTAVRVPGPSSASLASTTSSSSRTTPGTQLFITSVHLNNYTCLVCVCFFCNLNYFLYIT